VLHAGAIATGAAQEWQPKMPAMLAAGIKSTATAKPHAIVKTRIVEFDMTSPPVHME
jgi:hypothetical protein